MHLLMNMAIQFLSWLIITCHHTIRFSHPHLFIPPTPPPHPKTMFFITTQYIQKLFPFGTHGEFDFF